MPNGGMKLSEKCPLLMTHTTVDEKRISRDMLGSCYCWCYHGFGTIFRGDLFGSPKINKLMKKDGNKLSFPHNADADANSLTLFLQPSIYIQSYSSILFQA